VNPDGDELVVTVVLDDELARRYAGYSVKEAANA
jgi:hypothetical protein